MSSDSLLLPPKRFTGLHAHTTFSSFDGLGYPDQHIDFCLSNQLDSWAITDHGNGNGIAHAHAHAKKLKAKGQKYRQIYGVEFYMVPDLTEWKKAYNISKGIQEVPVSSKENEEESNNQDGDNDEAAGLVVEDADDTRTMQVDNINRRYHVVVVAKNRTGLSNLFTLVKRSFKEGFYKFPRIDFKMLKEHSEGLLVSTACCGGLPSGLIYREFPEHRFNDLSPNLIKDSGTINRIMSNLRNMTDRFVDSVGQENFFLEIQFNKLGAQDLTNLCLLKLHDETGIPLLATADSHYPGPDMWRSREIYRQLQPGRISKDGEPPKIPEFHELKAELYPKNAEQMWASFLERREEFDFYRGYEDKIRQSIELGYDLAWNVCDEIWLDDKAKLPSFKTEESSGFSKLVKLVKDAMVEEGFHTKKEYVERVKFELSDIQYLGFEDYFLTLQQVFKLAENRTLPGAGRGSGAGSLVNYLLGITHVDPLKYDLLWERFLGRHRCLDPNTLVLMSDGGFKKLADVNVGDEVITGKNRPKKVTQKSFSTHDVLYKVKIGNQVITCSKNHRWIVFRDEKEIEVLAEDLRENDLIRQNDNTFASITQIDSVEQKTLLIDITVEEDHTFFVSNDGNQFVLTHNSGWPDIDTDVGDREQLIIAAREIFGEESVVPVSNFNTLKLKSLVKDVSKLYGIPFEEVNAVTGPLEREVAEKSRDPNMEKSMFVLKHEDCLEHSPRYREFMEKYPQVETQVRSLFMMVRSCGRHAGGVLICPNLEQHMPVISVRGELQTPWTEGVNIRNLEENGFLKFDFLGIKQMQMVEDCIRRIVEKEKGGPVPFSEIKRFYDENLNCRYVEPNDSKVFQHVYQEGRWPGIFQFTSDGARRFCIEAQPENIEDLSAITAIYRPGPLKANVHKTYVDARNKKDDLKYDHPVIEKVLGGTYGHVCLAGNTRVLTENGELEIKDIVDSKIPVKLPSFNIETGEIEIDEAVQFFDQGIQRTLLIETEDGILEVTPNHKIMTNRGWVPAGELTLNDEIVFYDFLKKVSETRTSKIIDISNGQEQNVYDIGVKKNHNFFANGHLVSNCFQEQFMTLAQKLAGFTPGESDKMRKTLVKKDLTSLGKKSDEKVALEEKFVKGCMEISGMNYEKSKKLFDTIAFFSLYGFNRSHAVSYAIVSYYGAWLSTYYEKDWLATCLQSDNASSEKLAIVMSEIKQLGYSIAPPDVNYSGVVWNWSDELESFVPPLSSLKGIGSTAMDEIVAGRPYQNLDQLLFDQEGKWYHTKMNRKAFEALISMEAFSSLAEMKEGKIANHRQLYQIIIDNYAQLKRGRYGVSLKKALKFGVEPLLDRLIEENKNLEDWTRSEKVLMQAKVSGSAPYHLVFPDDIMHKIRKVEINPISSLNPGESGVAWFVIVEIEKKTSKNGKVFYRARVQDDTSYNCWIRIWGESKKLQPYSIWMAELRNESSWGISTNVNRMRLIEAGSVDEKVTT